MDNYFKNLDVHYQNYIKYINKTPTSIFSRIKMFKLKVLKNSFSKT
jgi:hypothetical protein